MNTAVLQAPANTADGDDRRAIPRLRAQTQDAFKLLVQVLDQAGQVQLADQLRGFNRIEDAMKADPRLIKNLIDLAWAFRSRGELAAFIAASDGSVAANEDTPLGPCGASFTKLRVTLLRATARVFLTAAARLSPDAGNGRTALNAATHNNGVVTRIKNLFGFEEDATPQKETLRHLYPLLQQNLVADHQFSLIGDYAKLTPWQITTLGEVLIGFTESAMVLAASNLKEDQLVSLVRLARMLAGQVVENGRQVEQFLPTKAKVLDDESSVGTAELVAGQSLGHLLVKHPKLADPIAKLDPVVAEDVIKRMVNSLGPDTWTVLSSDHIVRNVRSCPEFLMERLGAHAGNVHEGMAKAIDSVNYPEAAFMLINRVLDAVTEKRFPEVMAQKNFKHWQDAFKTINASPLLTKGADLTKGMAGLRMTELVKETYQAITK